MPSGTEIDYAKLIKLYGEDPSAEKALLACPIHWLQDGADYRLAGSQTHQHVVRGASKPHDSDVDAPLHSPYERLQQEARFTSCLQFRAHPPDASALLRQWLLA
jgi:hypothetical protein